MDRDRYCVSQRKQGKNAASKARFLTIVLIGVCLLACLPCTPLAAPVPVRVMAQPKVQNGSAASLYAEAKAFHASLEQDERLGGQRENWLAGVRRFRRLQLMHSTEELTINSLYMQGRLYRQMYERFRVPLDLDNAIDSFYDVAALYPKGSLADDSLYAAAEASLLHPVKKQQAQELLRKITRSYPNGDQVQAAAGLLARLSQSAPAKKPVPDPATRRSPTTVTRQAAPVNAAPAQSIAPAENAVAIQPSSAPTKKGAARSAEGLAWVEPVKYWSSDDYTRIVIPVTAAVPFAATLLEEKDGFPRRLFSGATFDVHRCDVLFLSQASVFKPGTASRKTVSRRFYIRASSGIPWAPSEGLRRRRRWPCVPFRIRERR